MSVRPECIGRSVRAPGPALDSRFRDHAAEDHVHQHRAVWPWAWSEELGQRAADFSDTHLSADVNYRPGRQLSGDRVVEIAERPGEFDVPASDLIEPAVAIAALRCRSSVSVRDV